MGKALGNNIAGEPAFVIGSSTATSFVVDAKGNVGIGTTTNSLNSRFYVDSFGLDTGINTTGNINSFFQINVQNLNSGSSVSSDVVATANNGSQTTHYIDMGINGVNGGGVPYTNANEAYLYSIDDTLNIGALGSAAHIIFHTTGGTSPVERMRLTSGGLLGLGT